MKIEHIAIWTNNIERLKAFYIKYFDATSNELYSNEKKRFQSYFLTFKEGARLEIMQIPDLADNPHYESLQAGYAHLAMAVGDETTVDSLTLKLKEDGYPHIDGPRKTGDGYYESVVIDPDGNRIEITV